MKIYVKPFLLGQNYSNLYSAYTLAISQILEILAETFTYNENESKSNMYH
jgi:hypothetical protein